MAIFGICAGWLVLSSLMALWVGGLFSRYDAAEARAEDQDAEDWP